MSYCFAAAAKTRTMQINTISIQPMVTTGFSGIGVVAGDVGVGDTVGGVGVGVGVGTYGYVGPTDVPPEVQGIVTVTSVFSVNDVS